MWSFRFPRTRRGAYVGLTTLVILVTLSIVSSSRLGVVDGYVTHVLPFPADDIATQQTALARMPAQYVAVTTLAHGEDIDAALRRMKLADPALQRTLRQDPDARTLRALGAGDDIHLRCDEQRRLQALVVQIESPVSKVSLTTGSGIRAMAGAVSGSRRVVVERTASGRFAVSETFQPHDAYWHFRSGVIGTGFFSSMARADVPGQIVAETLRLFRDRIDFRQGFRPGDAFHLIYEQLAGAMGPTRTGRLLAVELQARGTWHRAVWHPPARPPGEASPGTPPGDASPGGASPGEASRITAAATFPAVAGNGGRYFTFEGAPLHREAAWHMPIRAPDAGARIASSFGVRIHPLSGYSRHHEGVDLAAPRGTAVAAAAPGTISFAGWRNGYGRLLVIRHAPPYSTYYAHLDSFAPGIRAGRPVARGETIGQVGSTGAATGPHLHFELRIADRPVDPMPELRQAATPLRGEALRAFRHAASPLLAQIARMRALPAGRES
ncbi:M23 family metallopeptidase [Robbsia sp. Bb-Pol-6]|uniref:M23 family metallopeptidase n=1 Tax=Robbsia betulipollinis TaxID=2981849 RepID=A0ABT3ZLQ3_9BURK|nr:M23 family metallopeptidase [Robbsia betulipollinis]MCY0387352.1 M23 family metallopeptidase [Robbsia betulipollinis]